MKKLFYFFKYNKRYCLTEGIIHFLLNTSILFNYYIYVRYGPLDHYVPTYNF